MEALLIETQLFGLLCLIACFRSTSGKFMVWMCLLSLLKDRKFPHPHACYILIANDTGGLFVSFHWSVAHVEYS
jgi:hypothetical protein